ncbi:cdc42 effector protein 4 [Seriola lalandi dorsalis]|uniref:CDC42 effector protein 4 n=1 Tax=Seriola lalandi dorsalis TaxID=1841481 RepID=A0A3B4Y6P3_SERLL|nr:cdc42 effector protein 4 [Seriola lalandi dorsalis]XP_023287088.1 cdc42 effector protein 4 [Seriola lalandi dorsalis]XP_056221945.1 cdc42 effector protein 4 [Seriola aureovittata]
MPILKQLVNNSNQSKRRSRADLTAEMISAPLGDFRHTMHVGRGGDAFGDTSFLSTRSGEPPREPETKQASPGPKPGLLSRTFRSSKRSQSVNRGDKYDYNMMAPSGGSSNFVKNAISLPYLNDEDTNRSNQLPKSVSSSPMKKLTEIESKPINGAAAMATLDAEFDERNFGELTDLPPSMPKGGGMKHAESMMSFHIDLGPSMLGDILSVMEKKGWEEDDLGYEEGKSSEGHASPSLIPHIDDDDVEEQAPARPPRSMYQQKAMVDPYTPELHTRNNHHHHLDSCSVSSSGSATEEKPQYHLNDADTDSAKYSSPRGEDDRDFTFMDEDDDDEIRV